MGFELLNVLVAEDPSVLTAGFNSENLTLPLDFTPSGPFSRMTAGNKEVIEILETQPVTMNNHHSGVAPTAFYGNSKLTTMFDVVATNKDRDGKEFISTIEAKSYPIYSSQWCVHRRLSRVRGRLQRHSIASIAAHALPNPCCWGPQAPREGSVRVVGQGGHQPLS